MSQTTRQIALSQSATATQITIAPFGRLAALARSAAASVVRAYRYRRDIQHLRQLDNRILADIGIDRSEIVSVVYGDPTRKRRR